MKRPLSLPVLLLAFGLLLGCARGDGATQPASDDTPFPPEPPAADAVSPIPASTPDITPSPTPDHSNASEGTVLSFGVGTLLLRLADGTRLSFDTADYTGPAVLPGDAVTAYYADDASEQPRLTDVAVTKSNASIISGVIVLTAADRIYVQTAEDDVYGFITDADTALVGAATELGQDDIVHVAYTGSLLDAPKATIISTLSQALHTASPAPNEKTELAKTLAGEVVYISSKGFRLTDDAGDTFTFAFGKRTGTPTEITGRYTLAVGCRAIVTYHGLARNHPVAEIIQVISPHLLPTQSPGVTKAPVTPRPAGDQVFRGTVTSVSSSRLKALDKGREIEFHTADALFEYQYNNGEPLTTAKIAAGDAVFVRYFTLSGTRYASYVQVSKPLPTPNPTGVFDGAFVRYEQDKKVVIASVTSDAGETTEQTFNMTKLTGAIDFRDKDGNKVESTLAEGDTVQITYQIVDDVKYAIKVKVTKPNWWVG